MPRLRKALGNRRLPEPEASTDVAEKLEAELNRKVQYSCDLETNYVEAQDLIVELRKERDMFVG